MDYRRMPIEIESPEQLGYSTIRYNLSESSVSDAIAGQVSFSMDKLVLCYGNHIGEPKLRELIAAEAPGLTKDDVLITAGAAAALFIVATSLLEKEDHLVVIRPNYASNIETPRAIGCEISYCDLKFEDGFRIQMNELRSLIRKNTKLISVTHPHNPTGTVLSEQELKELAALAEEHHCYVLVDETYRDLQEAKTSLAASLSPRLLSVSSVSKAYGLPGLRIGWLVTKDTSLFEKFLAAKEQIFVCNSVMDEEFAYQYLLKKEQYFSPIRRHVEANKKIVLEWINSEQRMEMIIPSGGVVCFPRIRNIQKDDVAKFYELLNATGTYVGPGHWFEMPGNYMRIGFGWPTGEDLKTGLKHISSVLDSLEIR